MKTTVCMAVSAALLVVCLADGTTSDDLVSWESLGGQFYNDPVAVSSHAEHVTVYGSFPDDFQQKVWNSYKGTSFLNVTWEFFGTSSHLPVGAVAHAVDNVAEAGIVDVVISSETLDIISYTNVTKPTQEFVLYSTPLDMKSKFAPAIVAAHGKDVGVFVRDMSGRLRSRWRVGGEWEEAWEYVDEDLEIIVGPIATTLSNGSIVVIVTTTCGNLQARVFEQGEWSDWIDLEISAQETADVVAFGSGFAVASRNVEAAVVKVVVWDATTGIRKVGLGGGATKSPVKIVSDGHGDCVDVFVIDEDEVLMRRRVKISSENGSLSLDASVGWSRLLGLQGMRYRPGVVLRDGMYDVFVARTDATLAYARVHPTPGVATNETCPDK